MKLRDRIVEFRRFPASSLAPNPKNWRLHPVNPPNALRGLRSEIGISAAAIAVTRPEGLVLIDAHLRSEIVGNEILPVLVVDLNDEEADKRLTTFDLVSAMATGDPERVEHVLFEFPMESEAFHEMRGKITAESGLLSPDFSPVSEESPGFLDQKYYSSVLATSLDTGPLASSQDLEIAVVSCDAT